MLISTVVAAALAVAIWRQQRTEAARWFAATLAATSLAALAGALEAAVVPTWAKLIASKASYLGNVAIAPFFLMFSLQHSQPRPALSLRARLAMVGLPLLVLALVWTNEWHGLAWPTVTPTTGPQGAALTYGHGPAVFLVAAYSYVMLTISVVVLLRTVHHGPALYRRQARPVTMAIVLGVVANAIYLAGFGPWPGIDLMPVVLSACGALLGWSVFGLRMLDLVPVARGLTVEHLADAVLTFDQRRRLVDANPAARVMLGDPLTPGRDARQVLADYPAVWAALSQGVDGRVEQAIVADGGPKRWFDASLSTLRWLERPVGTVVVLRDVSDARQAEANRGALQRRLFDAHRDESLGRMAGGVAHHFNNQLGVALGHLELAERALSGMAGADRALNHIARSRGAAERMATLSREMLAYCGDISVQRETVQPAALINATAQLLSTSIRRDVTLELRLDVGLPMLEVDANELRGVLGHLVNNAVEACEGSPGHIVIAARAVAHGGGSPGEGWENGEALVPGDYLELAVTDDGSGMRSDVVEHAFEPFFTTKFTGRGLGLAQVLGLARGHQGALHIESAPGRGTTVKLWLPAQPAR